MPTKLTRPVTRRIGDLVVTLREDGLHIRRPRARKGMTVGWSWLEDKLSQPRTCTEAFESSLPRGWIPTIGERVWVRRRRGTLSNCVSRGDVLAIIPAVPQLLVKVQLSYGRSRVDVMLELSDVRPTKVETMKAE